MTALDDPLGVVRHGGVLELTLNRPKAANALSPDLAEAMINALENAQGVDLCVIRGAGRHFCAGFDLSDLESVSDGDLLWRFLRIEHLLQSVHHAGFVTLALGHGQCVGAGADLFAACAWRVAAPGARFRMPGWNFGLALGTRRLSALVGAANARDILLDTREVSAEEAVDIGLTESLAEPDTWGDMIDTLSTRAQHLPAAARTQMLGLTTADTRDADIAALVRSAGRPGLRARVSAYRDKVLAARAKAGGKASASPSEKAAT